MRLALWVSAHRRLLAELAIVVVAALVPRIVGLGTFLTADEKNWVGRGVEFVRAVREFRFNDTLQTTHPGIPTLWISGLSSAMVTSVQERAFSFDDILPFATASQIPLALLNSLLVVGVFAAARALFPGTLAFLAALTVALDPFLIGHSKIVHVDSLLAGFSALSLLLFLRAETSGWALAGSAVAGALAILSKLPGVILLPMALLVLFSRRGAWRKGERGKRLRLFGQWLTVMIAVILILWPGLLWVPDPVGNVKTVKRDLLVALVTPHHMADDYTLNPWHYPATLLTRTTIPTLVGFLLFLFFLFQATRLRRGEESEGAPASPSQASFGIDLRVAWLLVAFIILFIAGMMLGAKKGDRYILPVFPVLDLLAAVGVAELVAKVRPRWSTPRTVRLAGVLVLVPLSVEAIRLSPYQLAHYNQLFPPNVSQELGFGEGLDQVARFFNDMGTDQTAVASWYPEELRALVRRPVYHLNSHEQLPIGYVVLYRNMLGRSPGHPANDFLDEYYRKRQPVFTAEVNGLPYAWVYRKPVFQGIVGELTPEKALVAELPAERGDLLEGIELFLATYSRQANEGTLVAHVRESVGSPDLRTARYFIRGEDDNRWVRLTFDRPLETTADDPLVVLVTAEGTRPGQAPSVRFAPVEKGAPRYAVTTKRPIPENVLTGSSRRGLLGIRTMERSP